MESVLWLTDIMPRVSITLCGEGMGDIYSICHVELVGYLGRGRTDKRLLGGSVLTGFLVSLC